MSSWASFFGLRKHDPLYIVLSWNRRKYRLYLKDFTQGFEQATVLHLKQHAKRLTGVPMSTMALMYSGAYLKDDTAALPSCGIRPGEEREKVNQTASKDSEEFGYLTRIDKIASSLQRYKDEVDAFEALIKTDKHESMETKTVYDKGVFLSESLMQSLIALDGIVCPPEYETARTRRRAAVKLCQQLLDRVDYLKTVLNDLLKSKM
ncbi:hypothetical protein EC973_003038 [Apophysomyces ossiformis]|uniref:BAG domain-containing protein n=1 Tax=Apophysomyces ossiformis TaxID=679940 RepID=A0A8H7BY07_9FUNG|nr:hypothetical protein EC973_003038 [Apophysomyces ossiformis]